MSVAEYTESHVLSSQMKRASLAITRICHSHRKQILVENALTGPIRSTANNSNNNSSRRLVLVLIVREIHLLSPETLAVHNEDGIVGNKVRSRSLSPLVLVRVNMLTLTTNSVVRMFLVR